MHVNMNNAQDVDMLGEFVDPFLRPSMRVPITHRITQGGKQDEELKTEENAQQQPETRLQSRLQDGGALSSSMVQPWLRLDVVEDKDKYTVNVDVPGVKKEDIKLSCDNNVLTISADHKTEHEETSPDKKYHRRERSYGFVTRSIRLPRDCDETKISANFDHGLLKVRENFNQFCLYL